MNLNCKLKSKRGNLKINCQAHTNLMISFYKEEEITQVQVSIMIDCIVIAPNKFIVIKINKNYFPKKGRLAL